ncbi:MAG: hypothetical protein LBT40_17915 [Deltaproteobacteria bacterium]|jgi:formamidopyrimidine-DNA glycosylase|nr:hypothetical protein [Deltaproteobacteria bacterium]
MPELPEAQTIAQDLDGSLRGSSVARTELLFRPSLAGTMPLSELHGRAFTGAARRGKCVILRFGDLSLLASLRMTGQFVFGRSPGSGEGGPAGGKGKRSWPPHVRAALVLDGFEGPEGEDSLMFRDIRKFGRLHVCRPADEEALLPASARGRDVTELSPEEFHSRLASSGAPLKVALMDQGVMAGLGNIYATEILFEAGVSPFRPAASLSRHESDIILEAARSILDQAVRMRGSTVSNYQAPLGPGSYQELHKAYGKAGKPCPRCGTTLEKVRAAGRTTVFCPLCQK